MALINSGFGRLVVRSPLSGQIVQAAPAASRQPLGRLGQAAVLPPVVAAIVRVSGVIVQDAAHRCAAATHRDAALDYPAADPP